MFLKMAWFVKGMRAYMILNILVSGALDATNLLLNVSKHLKALSGSCLQIRCNFSTTTNANGDYFDGSRNTFGLWIKGYKYGNKPELVVYDSSQTKNKYPMNITGNLRENDCTTLFSNLNTTYSDPKYYFRIINCPFIASAIEDEIDIKIEDSPWTPTLDIPEELKENDSISVSCSALTPCPHSPPQLTWSLPLPAVNHTEENHDRTLFTKIQKNITLSDQDDGLNITCSASYPVDGGGMKTSEAAVTLYVSYAPKNTSASISASGLVSVGSWVNLTCSSIAKPAVSNFSWFRISQGGSIRESEGQFYSFNVSQGGVYYCVATNDLGNQTSQNIRLSIHGDPGSFPLKEVILGVVFGIFGLIILVIIVCWFTSKHSTKPKQQTNNAVEMVADQIHNVEDNIHYGEINFSKWVPGSSPSSGQDCQQPQETVYAEVKGNQAADEPNQVYAQVNKVRSPQ